MIIFGMQGSEEDSGSNSNSSLSNSHQEPTTEKQKEAEEEVYGNIASSHSKSYFSLTETDMRLEVLQPKRGRRGRRGRSSTDFPLKHKKLAKIQEYE
jgi:hypothetical protein